MQKLQRIIILGSYGRSLTFQQYFALIAAINFIIAC